MSFHKPLLAALLVGSAAISPLACATNGYFAHGYGIKRSEEHTSELQSQR